MNPLQFSFIYFLDLLIGDPKWVPHPVRLIGWEIDRFFKLSRYINSPTKKRTFGFVMALTVIGSTYLFTRYILVVSRYINPTMSWVIGTYLGVTTLATKSLHKESQKVISALIKGDINDARKALSFLVSRDTSGMDQKKILSTLIETIAENISDGVIAPMLYLVIGGVPVAMAYKAASTLDSMVGYRHEPYREVGWASARLDDILNFIPARLTSILIIVGAFILRLDFKKAFQVVLRDAKKHASPNAGYPEAAIAGALGIKMGGPSVYFSRLVEKPEIGDQLNEVDLSTYNTAILLLYITSIIMFILSCVFLVII